MKKDNIATKSIKKGVEYKHFEDIQVTESETVGMLLGNMNAKIKALGHDLERLFNSNDSVISTIEEVEKQLLKIKDTLSILNANDNKIITQYKSLKHNRVSDIFSHFKVDLMMNLLHPSVKREFDDNNSNGGRIKELQKWFDELGTNAHTKKPKEIELYEYIGGVNSGKNQD